MEPITLTMAGAVTALMIEASKEAGKAIAKGGTDLIGSLVSLVRDRFKANHSEQFLIQLQEQPTEVNQSTFSALLAVELMKDPDFAREIAAQLKTLKSDPDANVQRVLVDLKVDDLTVGDIIQRSSGQSSNTQEAAKNIKGKNIKIGNITQEN